MKRGAPLQRRTPLRTGGRLRYQSAKRAAVAPARRKLVADLLQRFPVCRFPTTVLHPTGSDRAVVVDRGCRNRSVHIHEIKSRARGGSILDERNTIPVCFDHHRWIHDHPDEASQLGVLAHSWEAS
jgi:hypothetical protein